MKFGKYFGKLIFPNNELELESCWLQVMEESILVEIPTIFNHKAKWETVHGHFNGLGKISLIHVYPSGSSSGFGGNTSKLIVGQIVEGVFLNSAKELFVTKFRFRWQNLGENWIREDLFSDYDEKTNSIIQSKPIEILSFTCSHIFISIKIHYINHHRSFDIDVRRVCTILFQFAKPIHLGELKKELVKFERLMMLLTSLKPDFDNYYLNNSHNVYWPSKTLDQNYFPITFDVNYKVNKERLPLVFDIWYREVKLQQVANLLLEKYYQPHLWRNRYLLNLMVGLESFHKNLVKSKKVAYDIRLRAYNSIFKRLEVEEIFKLPLPEILKKIKNTRDSLSHDGVYEVEFSTGIEAVVLEFMLRLTLHLKICEYLGIDLDCKVANSYEQAKMWFHGVAHNNNYKGIQEKT
jgi:hypothetical protein